MSCSLRRRKMRPRIKKFVVKMKREEERRGEERRLFFFFLKREKLLGRRGR